MKDIAAVTVTDTTNQSTLISMSHTIIPEDFPRSSGQGAVSGYHPKLLLRDVNGEYVAGPTDDELFARYDASEDLARQLTSYATRKRAENPSWSFDETLAKVEAGVAEKVSRGLWDISAAELAWIMKRVRELARGAIGDAV